MQKAVVMCWLVGVGLAAGLGLPVSVARGDTWEVPELAPPATTAVRLQVDGAAIVESEYDSTASSVTAVGRLARGEWAWTVSAGVARWTQHGTDVPHGQTAGVAATDLGVGAVRWWRVRDTAWRLAVRAAAVAETPVDARPPALRVGLGRLVGEGELRASLAAGARRDRGAWVVQGEVGVDAIHLEGATATATSAAPALWSGATVARRVGDATWLGGWVLARTMFGDDRYEASVANAGLTVGLGVATRVGPGALRFGAAVRREVGTFDGGGLATIGYQREW